MERAIGIDVPVQHALFSNRAVTPLMRAIVLSSLFLRVFMQLQLWHGVVFGIVRHKRKV
jgi:hypothetical protein